tara:strand:+ start:95 stop:289 length:195 start_codon:yes stop_codon:yes gene_type:complete
MKLNDEVISHIAKLVQLAILSGTDVVDHLRMIMLEESEGELYLAESYVDQSEQNIQKMLNEVKS